MKLLFRTFLVLVWTGVSLNARAQSHNALSEEREIVQAASNALPSCLERIPTGKESYYGFRNREEFNLATLGQPVKTYTLTEDFYKTGICVQALKGVDEYRIPVIVGRQYRALLTLTRRNGRWSVEDFGATALAAELDSHKGAARYSLLRIYPLQCDFMLVYKGEEASGPSEVRPLRSVNLSIAAVSSGNAYSLAEVLPAIHKSYEQKTKAAER